MALKKSEERPVDKLNRPSLSACDIMSNSATNIITKMESALPINMQMYSDFYKEYLHSLQDLFGACYISEKEVLDKIGIDQKSLEYFDAYTQAFTKSAVSQIEFINNIQKTYLQTSISTVRSADQLIHIMLDNYSRMLSKSFDFYGMNNPLHFSKSLKE